MNQSFSSQQLIKYCKKNELELYGLTQKQLLTQLDDVYERIIQNSFCFNLKKVNNYYFTEELSNKLILRKLNDNLKRLYKDEQSNRRIIISQIIRLLQETSAKWILKTDVESFYETIERNKLIEKLKNDAMLSYYSLYLLNELFNNSILIGFKGLPRGLNISATLSEIFMRKFDKWIRRCKGVYYYARYVDDIIIFGNKRTTIELIRDQINDHLEPGLIKKEKKTFLYDDNSLMNGHTLDFLGYNLQVSQNMKEVIVRISAKKIKKIKTRIVFTFLDFIKNRNFRLLEMRIKFLTGNFSVRKSKDGHDLKAGIFYNYPNVNDISIFDQLNEFYQKTLHAKNYSFGTRLSERITETQRDALSKYSFKHGFLKKTYTSFTRDEIKTIKACWNE